jgi:hypothetical protein
MGKASLSWTNTSNRRTTNNSQVEPISFLSGGAFLDHPSLSGDILYQTLSQDMGKASLSWTNTSNRRTTNNSQVEPISFLSGGAFLDHPSLFGNTI